MNAHPVTLITGSSRGLGRSMAEHLAAQGHDLIITWRERADEAAAVVATVQALGRQAVALQLDVADVDQHHAFAQAVQAALREHWQREQLDVLVNNAGFGVHAALAETTVAQFDALMGVHFRGMLFLTQALLPLIADGGRILNLSSGLARFSLPGYGAYAAMKGAVEVLSRYLAKELGPRQISVNTLAPGAIETDFGGGAVRDTPQLKAMIASQTALGRVGLPEDVGAAVAALLAPGTGWINGQRIEVSGGVLL